MDRELMAQAVSKLRKIAELSQYYEFEKAAASYEKLDSNQVLNFIKFFSEVGNNG
jgi:hypothetical protein